jgi:nucleoside-diphosphate-sugar epimerase
MATATTAIWLTGASGFIGHHLVPFLQADGLTLRCITNNPDAGRAKPPAEPQSGSPRHYMDFSKPSDIRRVMDQYGVPDVVYHLGWGGMTEPGSDVHLTTNVTDAQTLIDTVFQAGTKKFIFLGSVNEYGARHGLLREDMSHEDPRTNYAIGKTMVATHGFKKAEEFGRVFVSVRLFYTYGPGQRAGSLINKLYRHHVEKKRPDLGPCEHFRDYIYVGEVAEGLDRMRCIEKSAVVNLGSGKVAKLRDFVTLFWKSMDGDPADIMFGANPMRAGEPEQPYSFADMTLLKSLTHWTPQLTLEQGIQKTIAALRASPP